LLVGLCKNSSSDLEDKILLFYWGGDESVVTLVHCDAVYTQRVLGARCHGSSERRQ